MEAVGLLPGQQHLGSGPGPHAQGRPDRHRVAQTHGAFGRGHAQAQIALAAEELRRFTGLVAQLPEHRSGGGEEAILAGGRRELGQSRTEDEASLEVTADDAVELEGDGETVGGRSSESGERDELGQRRRSGLEGGENHCGLVDDTDAATIACHRHHCARLIERDASSECDTGE